MPPKFQKLRIWSIVLKPPLGVYECLLIFFWLSSSFECRTILGKRNYVVSMFQQIICILVIYSLSMPRMLSDPISQSGKALVRLYYSVFCFIRFLILSLAKVTVLHVISLLSETLPSLRKSETNFFQCDEHPLYAQGLTFKSFEVLIEQRIKFTKMRKEKKKRDLKILFPISALFLCHILSNLLIYCRNCSVRGDVNASDPFNLGFRHCIG